MKNLYILLAIGLVIFLIIKFPHATINPGELAESHQKLNNECLSCHKPFGGISSEKCISCHSLKDIGKNNLEKDTKPLFHQHLSNQKCSSCHSEHQGLIPEHRIGGFKHELLSPTIVNNCINCHKKPKDNFHKAINDNCNKCHSTSKWMPSTFDHSAYFILDQNHQTTCITCHSNNNYSSFTCYGCHEHTERNIIAEHREEGINNISNCTSCHKSGNENDIKSNYKRQNDKERKSKDKKEKDDD
jgi:hypothetical protein